MLCVVHVVLVRLACFNGSKLLHCIAGIVIQSFRFTLFQTRSIYTKQPVVGGSNEL